MKALPNEPVPPVTRMFEPWSSDTCFLAAAICAAPPQRQARLTWSRILWGDPNAGRSALEGPCDVHVMIHCSGGTGSRCRTRRAVVRPGRGGGPAAVTGSPSRVSSTGRSSSGCWPDCRSRSTDPGDVSAAGARAGPGRRPRRLLRTARAGRRPGAAQQRRGRRFRTSTRRRRRRPDPGSRSRPAPGHARGAAASGFALRTPSARRVVAAWTWADPRRCDQGAGCHGRDRPPRVVAADRRRVGRHRPSPRGHRGGAGESVRRLSTGRVRLARRTARAAVGGRRPAGSHGGAGPCRQCCRYVGVGSSPPRCADGVGVRRRQPEAWLRPGRGGGRGDRAGGAAPEPRCSRARVAAGAPGPARPGRPGRPGVGESSTAAAPGGLSAPGSSCCPGSPKAQPVGRSRQGRRRSRTPSCCSAGATTRTRGRRHATPTRCRSTLTCGGWSGRWAGTTGCSSSGRTRKATSGPSAGTGGARTGGRSRSRSRRRVVARAWHDRSWQRVNAPCSRASGGRPSASPPSGEQRGVSGPVHEIGVPPRGPDRRSRVRAFRKAVGRRLASRGRDTIAALSTTVAQRSATSRASRPRRSRMPARQVSQWGAAPSVPLPRLGQAKDQPHRACTHRAWASLRASVAGERRRPPAPRSPDTGPAPGDSASPLGGSQQEGLLDSWRRRVRTGGGSRQAWQWVSDSAPPETVIPVALQLSRPGRYAFAAGILTRTNLEAATPEQRRPVGRALIHGVPARDGHPLLGEARGKRARPG